MKHLGKLAAGIAVALFACGAASAKSSALDISLSPVSDKADAGSGKLRYTIRNTGKVDLLVLAWETPLRGIDDDLFDVALGGEPVEYVGRQFKRGLPQPSDYIQIEAGAALSVDIDLSAHYDMRAKGVYTAQAIAHFHDGYAVHAKDAGDEKLVALDERDLRSEAVTVFVDGAEVPYAQEPYGMFSLEKAGSVAFVGCSNGQVSSINSGLTTARSYTTNASSYLNAGNRGPRYTTWFGTYSSTNHTRVKNNFAAIGDALNNRALVFDCSTCTQNAYAYVYPTQPYKIYLCGAYWSAPTTGTDSKAGTTIHEVSHFDVVANTDDLAYGQAACKRLAKNASKAIRNADSHEYFGENTPPLN